MHKIVPLLDQSIACVARVFQTWCIMVIKWAVHPDSSSLVKQCLYPKLLNHPCAVDRYPWSFDATATLKYPHIYSHPITLCTVVLATVPQPRMFGHGKQSSLAMAAHVVSNLWNCSRCWDMVLGYKWHVIVVNDLSLTSLGCPLGNRCSKRRHHFSLCSHFCGWSLFSLGGFCLHCFLSFWCPPCWLTVGLSSLD